MGGRYGASSDGSSDYQSRQPSDDDLDDEQQTVAEAVRSAAGQQQDDSDADGQDSNDPTQTGTVRAKSDSDGAEGNDESSDSDDGGQHPLTAFLDSGQSGANKGFDILADIDEGVADQLAKRLTDQVQEAVEETDPDE